MVGEVPVPEKAMADGDNPKQKSAERFRAIVDPKPRERPKREPVTIGASEAAEKGGSFEAAEARKTAQIENLVSRAFPEFEPGSPEFNEIVVKARERFLIEELNAGIEARIKAYVKATTGMKEGDEGFEREVQRIKAELDAANAADIAENIEGAVTVSAAPAVAGETGVVPTTAAPPVAEEVHSEPLSARFDAARFSETLMTLDAEEGIPADFAPALRAALKANIAKVLHERVIGGMAKLPGAVLEKSPGAERDKATREWIEKIAEGQATDLTTEGSVTHRNAFYLYTSVKEGLAEGLAQEDRDPDTEAMRVAIYALTNAAKITAPGPFGSQPTGEGTLGDPLDKIFENVAEAVLRRDSSHAAMAGEKLGRLFTGKQRELAEVALE